MKKALIVGIDYYADISSLYGCVKDANAVKQALERHADGSINFSIQLLCSTGPRQYICLIPNIKLSLLDLSSFDGGDQFVGGFSVGHCFAG